MEGNCVVDALGAVPIDLAHGAEFSVLSSVVAEIRSDGWRDILEANSSRVEAAEIFEVSHFLRVLLPLMPILFRCARNLVLTKH